MNAEMLKQAAQRKKEIDQVAKELGYENANQAAADLRALGVLPEIPQADTPFVDVMMAEPPKPKYDMATNQEVRDIARAARRKDYATAKIAYTVRRIGNKYITVKQFSFLMNGVDDFAEDHLFAELVDNIFDLHNYDKIPWRYSHHRSNLYSRFVGLYPAMTGREHEMPSNIGFVVGTHDSTLKKVENIPTKVAKQFNKKEVGFIAVASAILGFILGALLL